MKNIKYFLLTALLAVLILPNFASAMTAEELIAKIKDLQQQIEQLKAELVQIQGQAPAWCHEFRENLKIGTKDEEAAALHTVLEKEGFNVFNEEKADKEFGESTASAVSGFQQKYQDEILAPLGLKYGTGFLGKATRTKLNTLYGCGVKATPAPFCSPVAAGCESGSKSKIVCPPGLNKKGCPFPCKCVPVACTQEAKVCPDGSTVSRIPPSCEFAACPDQTINQPPVIYGINGPTFLKVNEIGFWTIKASDPENGHLVYSVEWGDGSAAQTATFTHSFSKAGIYSPTFIVIDNENLAVKTSITVKVEETISPDIIYEQVKCVFNGSQTEQKCYTSGETYSGYSCSGIETCVTDVKGRKGDKLTWKSSCGGYAYTTMDGQNEYAEFKCILPVSTPASTPTTPTSTVGTSTRKFKPIDPSRCPGIIETSCTIEPANIIKVSVYDEKGSFIDTKENNNSGMAGFLDLPYGNYTVVINAEGFEYYKASFTACATCEAITTIYLKKTSILSTSPSITVLSPNGGETWSLGSIQSIRWTSSNVTRVSLDLVNSAGSLVIKNLVNITGNPGSVDWVIPTYIQPGQYWMRAGTCSDSAVSCITTGSIDPVTIYDTSDAPFSIVSATTGLKDIENYLSSISQAFYFVVYFFDDRRKRKY